MDLVEELLAGFLELLRRLIVTRLLDNPVEYFKALSRFQIGLWIG